MRELLNQLEELTENLVANLDSADYVHLEQFVEIREQYMQEFKELGLSNEDVIPYQEQIQRIIGYDEPILERMNQLKEEAQRGIDRTQQVKKQQKIYETNYTPDSLFYDSKN